MIYTAAYHEVATAVFVSTACILMVKTESTTLFRVDNTLKKYNRKSYKK